ncbi:hypothetical protein ASD72_12935 [Pseudoxanthomonas sp. Root630]|nr:hypothetical protein ASD72_12935 [Pseudoxanthomonas sp. Root630]
MGLTSIRNALEVANSATRIRDDWSVDTDSTNADQRLLELIAALVNGDRWLCAGAGAAYLGQMPKKTFLAFACQPGFPVALRVGKRRMWRKSELDEWAERQRAAQRRQRA